MQVPRIFPALHCSACPYLMRIIQHEGPWVSCGKSHVHTTDSYDFVKGASSDDFLSTKYQILLPYLRRIFFSSALSLRVCMLSCFSGVWLFAILWTVAHQPPLSIGFSRQEYWSGLPFPSPGDLSELEIELASPVSPALAGGFFTTEQTGKPQKWSMVESKSLWKFHSCDFGNVYFQITCREEKVNTWIKTLNTLHFTCACVCVYVCVCVCGSSYIMLQ